jgi:hypothetical protein
MTHYLRNVISGEGIVVDLTKVEAIMEWTTPTNFPKVRSFMGLARYYGWFIEGFSKLENLITEFEKRKKKFV